MTSYSNHNPQTTAQEIELDVEVIEEVIAPSIQFNHNETAEIELVLEEVEEVIAPGIMFNTLSTKFPCILKSRRHCAHKL